MAEAPYIPDTFQNGTEGDDVLIGTQRDEAFYFIRATRSGAPVLAPADRIVGGGGTDVLVLQFDWRNRIDFLPTTIAEVESIVLLGSGDRRFGYAGATTWYDLALAADNVRAGTALTVDATGLGNGDASLLDAGAISGQLRYRGGVGQDHVTGGRGRDVFTFGPGGFDATDSIRGGAGDDLLILQGNHRLSLDADSIEGVEELWLLSRGDRVEGAPGTAAATSYDLTLVDQAIDAPPLLMVHGTDLLADETMRIDASRIARSELRLYGGAGADQLIGGVSGGWLIGGGGADVLSIAAGGRYHVSGGAGDDTVLAGAMLTSGDSLDLGTGRDRLELDGRYDALQLGHRNDGVQVDGLDAILLHGSADASAPNSYAITLNAGLNPRTGRSLDIDASDLAAGETVRLDAAEYDASIFYVAGSGTDRVTGSKTFDWFVVRGGTLQADDRFDGGDIHTINRLRFEGGGSFALSSANFTNISHIDLAGSGGGATQRYDLTMTTTLRDDRGAVTIDVKGLRAGDGVRIDAGRYASLLYVESGDANDVITASAAGGGIATGRGADFVSIAFGTMAGDNIGDARPARYTVNTGDGDDGIYVGNAFHGDRIDGGAGNDQLGLQGYYQDVTLANITGIETIVLLTGNDDRFDRPAPDGGFYSLIAPDALAAAGQRMIVNMNTLRDGDVARFDASRESDGSYLFFGGAGREGLTGGAGSDGFYFGRGAFGFGDAVNGGDGGDDQLGLQGDYAVVLGPETMTGIETLVLLGSRVTTLGGASDTPFAYDIRIGSAHAHTAPAPLTISANTLAADETLRFDGSGNDRFAYTVYAGDGQDRVTGGAGDDRLYGRGGDDMLAGGGGRDLLSGGTGADTFAFLDGAAGSSGGRRDTILDFDPLVDRIAIPRGDDTHRLADLTGFALSEATFDRDLAQALGDALEQGGVLFAQAASGDLAGRAFLIADANGIAGYQAGEDLVIELAGVAMLPGQLEWLV